MANNLAIKILRGTREKIVAHANQNAVLEPGQLLYNLTDNYLSVGDNNNSKMTKSPIKVRELGGYFSDSNGIGSLNTAVNNKFSVKPNSNGLEIKSGQDINIEAADILNVNSGQNILKFKPDGTISKFLHTGYGSVTDLGIHYITSITDTYKDGQLIKKQLPLYIYSNSTTNEGDIVSIYHIGMCTVKLDFFDYKTSPPEAGGTTTVYVDFYNYRSSGSSAWLWIGDCPVTIIGNGFQYNLPKIDIARCSAHGRDVCLRISNNDDNNAISNSTSVKVSILHRSYSHIPPQDQGWVVKTNRDISNTEDWPVTTNGRLGSWLNINQANYNIINAKRTPTRDLDLLRKKDISPDSGDGQFNTIKIGSATLEKQTNSFKIVSNGSNQHISILASNDLELKCGNVLKLNDLKRLSINNNSEASVVLISDLNTAKPCININNIWDLTATASNIVNFDCTKFTIGDDDINISALSNEEWIKLQSKNIYTTATNILSLQAIRFKVELDNTGLSGSGGKGVANFELSEGNAMLNISNGKEIKLTYTHNDSTKKMLEVKASTDSTSPSKVLIYSGNNDNVYASIKVQKDSYDNIIMEIF